MSAIQIFALFILVLGASVVIFLIINANREESALLLLNELHDKGHITDATYIKYARKIKGS